MKDLKIASKVLLICIILIASFFVLGIGFDMISTKSTIENLIGLLLILVNLTALAISLKHIIKSLKLKTK